MALITDPDTLTFEVVATVATGTTMVSYITDTVPPRIKLTETGALSADGVTGQCLYSKTKEVWGADATAVKFLFPMEGITPESFEFINDWRPLDDATRKLIRTCGFAERASGAIVQEWMGFISLGNIDSTSKTVGDKAYFSFAGDVARTVFTYAGPVDEPVQIYGGPSDGNFDSRASVLTARVREQGKTFGQITTTDIGVSTLTYIAYRFPLSEATDLNYSDQSPYTGMTIGYYSATQQSNTFLTTDLSGGPYPFHVIVDPNNNTANKTYAFMKDRLRVDGDINDVGDAGAVNGYLADDLVQYTGSTFETLLVSQGGVALDGDLLDSNDINSVEFADDNFTTTRRAFAFVAAGNFSFNSNLVSDSNGQYWMFYTTNPGGDFGTTSAILVDNNAGSDIAGAIGGASIAWDFDYDGNVQGGRSSGTDADVTVVAIGAETGQYVSTTHTITRTTGQNISLVGALERNYSNP